MARYWNHKNLTISGLEPGSRVFVSTTKNDGDIDEHVFNDKIVTDTIDVNVPLGQLFIRVRKASLKSFDTTLDMIEDKQHLTVIRVRDD